MRSWGTQHDIPAGGMIELPCNGPGQLYSVRVSQSDSDPGGQTVRLYSSYPGGEALIGSFVISPRGTLPGSRLAAVVYAPGARFVYGIVSSSPTPPRPDKLRMALDPSPPGESADPGITLVLP